MPAPVHPSVWCLRLQSRARMTAGDSSVIAIVRLTVFCSAAPGSPHAIIAEGAELRQGRGGVAHRHGRRCDLDRHHPASARGRSWRRQPLTHVAPCMARSDSTWTRRAVPIVDRALRPPAISSPPMPPHDRTAKLPSRDNRRAAPSRRDPAAIPSSTMIGPKTDAATMTHAPRSTGTLADASEHTPS